MFTETAKKPTELQLLLLDKAGDFNLQAVMEVMHSELSMQTLTLRPKVHLACRQSVVLKGGSRFFGSMDSIPESGQ